MFSGRTEEEALERAAKKFNVAKELIKLQQGAEHSSTVFLYTYLCGSIYSSAMQMGITVLLYTSVCDDRYHACTFAWDKLCALFTPH